ncbi:DUF4386 domain-containing protein [Lacinutrix iliipiscaria]|uniref:DUF4386 domain-containing protein n=1 Tax=Lacinutrix iliipiscaria TaxID=1230532 RepID=A0ABW5WQM7_9FLAO
MKQVAKVSGIAYTMIFLAGFYANFAVLESLVDTTSSAITTANFINNHSQLGNGLLAFVIMLFFDLILVWSLFGLTKSVNRKVTYIASIFRFLHALFFGIALIKLWKIYSLTLTVSHSTNLQHRISELLSNFDILWTIGLVFFGIHLIFLGSLIIKSTYMPKALGILLLLAALGYIIDGVAKLSMPNYVNYKNIFEVIVIMPSVIGEFSFTVWLLIKGLKKGDIIKKKKNNVT